MFSFISGPKCKKCLHRNLTNLNMILDQPNFNMDSDFNFDFFNNDYLTYKYICIQSDHSTIK